MSMYTKTKDKIIALRLKKNYHKNHNGLSKESLSKKIVFAVFTVLFIYQSVVCLFPLFFSLINSVKTQQDFVSNMLGLPKVWHWEFWMDIIPSFKIGDSGFWDMVWNSIWFAFGSQFLNLLASIFVAYPLARYKFPGKEFLYGIIIFRITIPIVGTSAVGYKLERALGMINNPPVYLIGAFAGFDMQALIMYGYVKAVGKEYSEAAVLDGANSMQVLFRVVLPQAYPCIIALYVNAVMGAWNNYNAPMISFPKFPNLAYGIYLIEGNSAHGANSKAKMFGCILLSGLVPLIMFAASQKLMLNNMSVGGLKG